MNPLRSLPFKKIIPKRYDTRAEGHDDNWILQLRCKNMTSAEW